MMKKNIIVVALLLGATALFAEVKKLPATAENIQKFDQIVDIRSPQEIREVGAIPGAKIVGFEKDKKKFLEDLKAAQIDISKPFAIICRGGRRSAFAAELIDDKSLDVTVLDGGMKILLESGYKTQKAK